MCFSATASFTAAAVLLVQGLATLKLVKQKRAFFLFALIPFFFAIQQLSEGLIWTRFNQGLPIDGFALIAAFLFLMFAFLVWPIMIPLSLWRAEEVKWRKKVLFWFAIGGFLWILYLILTVPHYSVSIQNRGNSIGYSIDYFTEPGLSFMRATYLSLLLIPIFFSSLRYMWIFGITTLVSAMIAYYFYETTFTSVWCFLAAILSMVLYSILKANIKCEHNCHS